MFLLVFFAFVAGIVTVLSPCILPVLPIVLSGSATGGKKRPFGIIVGFVISFTFFTLFTSALVQALHLPPDALRNIAIVLLILFGVSLFVPQVAVWLEHLMSNMPQHKGAHKHSGFGGGFLIGLTLGLFWTPCVGPILAGVITLAASSSVTWGSFFITLAYSIGTAIPMFGIAVGGRALLNKIPWVTRHTATIQKTFGAIMVILALGLFFNIDRQFQTFVLDAFPQYGSGLTKFEENDMIRQELERLQVGGDTSFINSNNMNTNSSVPKTNAVPVGELSVPAPNPNFDGATKWLGTEPLTLDKLKGKVVLVDFWTYTCINCIRTLPFVTSWYDKYKDDGLVVIGVHTPEFEFEKKEENVLKAMQDYKIHYPVVQDNDYRIWRSYSNRFWPAEYFIDKNGNVRRTHFGEGEYDESEKFIQKLLSENGPEVKDTLTDMPNLLPTYAVTPESYLGYGRLERFASPEQIKPNEITGYSIPKSILVDNFAYGGNWMVGEERAMPKKSAKLELHFQAKKVYLVMRSANGPTKVQVWLDGKKVTADNGGEDVKDGIVTVNEDRLYELINLPQPQAHTLTLDFLDEGTEVYAFTFG